LSNHASDYILGRWKAENCKHFYLNANCFIKDKNGKVSIIKEVKNKITYLLSKKTLIFFGGSKDNRDIGTYKTCLRNLLNGSGKPISILDQFRDNYINTLQLPLQPLRDNVCQEIYQLFEKDHMKYVKYKEVVKYFQ